MAKKKHRDIVVDGVQYAWTTRNMGHKIVIWKDKKVLFEKDNDVHPITPSYIREIIKDNVH